MAKAVIAADASLSGAVSLGGYALVAIKMPADWTAASLTFQASDDDDDTFYNMYSTDGTELTAQAADDRWIAIAPSDFVGARYIKIRSGTSGTPVNQAAERTLQVIVRPV